MAAAAGFDGKDVMSRNVKLGILGLAAALLIYPLLFSGAFALNVGSAVLLAAISASAWNIVGGYAGQISVGHGMFFGVGAYVPLLIYQHAGLPPLAGVPLGIALSIVLAVIIGLPAFRLRGHYFSMATIAVAELIRIFTGTWEYVGAAIGLQGPAVGRGWWDLTFRDETPYYYIFLGVLAVVLYVTYELQRSRFGSYLRAIKSDERAASSLGVSVRMTKLKALVLSAIFTSIAGSLYSIKTGFVDPESGFGILVSVQMVIIAALGGAGSLFGPLVGAIILVSLQTATNTWFGGGGSGLTYILYGGIIVLIARYEPGGLYEYWQRISPRLWRSRRAA
jgi:branched-chain amino acid transport system permease protein